MIRGAPVVIAHYDDPQEVKPLWASEMVAEIHKKALSFIGKIDDGTLRQILHMAKSIVLQQIHIRGLQTSSDVNWLSVELNPSDPRSVIVAVLPGCLEQLDLDLRNRECRRCGGLLTFGIRHTREDCDETLVRDVIDS